MDNPHSFHDPQYNPIFDKVTSLQYKFHDITKGAAASHPTTRAMQNEIHQLLRDVTVERSAHTLNNRIATIQRELKDTQISAAPVIDFESQNILYTGFDSLHKDVNNFHPRVQQ
jgi:hypothetical protein